MTKSLVSLHKALQTNPFVLAPMAGITDHAFRTFMKKRGAGVVVTELVSATGLEYGSVRTKALMSFDSIQSPIGIQFFGEEPDHVARAAQIAQEMGADFVDLNFGCPVPKVVKKGAGSAMLKDLKALTQMVSTVVRAVEVPVTIKIRTGWDANSINAHEVCKIAFEEGIAWVAIHGRTRAQGYSGLADWNMIAEVKSKAKLPIIGNGDILTAQQAVDRLKSSGCDGVMVGRGVLKNPFLFQDALALLGQQNPDKQADRSYETLFLDLKVAIASRCDEFITQIQLKKFAAWFATGYPGAAQFRKAIFQAKTTDEVTQVALGYFRNLDDISQEDTSHEAFLMGGHG